MKTLNIDRASHSYLLGVAEAEIEHYREILADLVRCADPHFSKLPEGYAARRAIDRAKAKLGNPVALIADDSK